MEIKTYHQEIPPEIIKHIQVLSEEVLGSLNMDELNWRIKNQDDLLLLMAFDCDKPHGF